MANQFPDINPSNSFVASPIGLIAHQLPKASDTDHYTDNDIIIINDDDIITTTPIPKTIKPGLENRGNYCFINSVMQCLAVSPFMLSFFARYEKDDERQLACSRKYNIGKVKVDQMTEYIKSVIEGFHDKGMNSNEYNILTKIAKHTDEIFIYLCCKDIIMKLQSRTRMIESCGRLISLARNLHDSSFEYLFNGSQNDPHEFLVYLLDKLHTAKSGSVKIDITPDVRSGDIYYLRYLEHFKKRYEHDFSHFVKNLYYYTINIIECSNCRHQYLDLSPNDVMCLSLPADWASRATISLNDCIDEMFKIESIDYKCEKCGNTTENRIDKKILTKPRTIIFKIKRYAQIKSTLYKVNKHITYSPEIDLSKYHCGNQLKPYKLYGIVNHVGNLNSGHYYSYINDYILHKTNAASPTSAPAIDTTPEFTDQWFECNDDITRPISLENAMSSSNAYMLFYHSSN